MIENENLWLGFFCDMLDKINELEERDKAIELLELIRKINSRLMRQPRTQNHLRKEDLDAMANITATMGFPNPDLKPLKAIKFKEELPEDAYFIDLREEPKPIRILFERIEVTDCLDPTIFCYARDQRTPLRAKVIKGEYE